jgi:outer membrane protein OmpA-like peptidoglycan-associated protein
MAHTEKLAAGLLALAVLAGCTDDPPPPGPTAAPAPSTAEATPAEATPAADIVETRPVDAAGDLLTMAMLPLTRTGAPGTVVLTVRTTVDKAADGGAGAMVIRHFTTIFGLAFDTARLVDTDARRVYPVATGPDGDRCVCTPSQRFDEGEPGLLQAVFTGIPDDVTRLSVMLPYAGVFADVPIRTGPAPVPARGDPLDPSRTGATAAADLDAYTQRLDVPLITRRTPRQVELTLDADILFRVDSAQLTPAAAESVAAAVADLRRAGPSPLTVTGHTDSDASAAHNQTLSEQRARTVADALTRQLPDARWPKTVAGRGETRPAVANDTAAHRRLNRRVTIGYRPKPGAAPAPAPAAGPLPKTKGTVVRAPAGFEATLPLSRGTVRFTAGRAVARGQFLQVDLLARAVGDRPATVLDYLGQGAFTIRDEFDPYAPYGASGVRLLTAGTIAYGLDYLIEDRHHRCLCDRLLNQAIPPGSEQRISLWFPLPPAGTATVTIDVPDKFRLTDVPIG